MTITVDNASSNDTAVATIRRGVRGLMLNGDYLHVRCVAHIMNLVVQDGLHLANMSVARVREAVKYVKKSPSRLIKFKACVE